MPTPLTSEQATAVLRRHLDGAATCTHVERGPVGNGQETWFLDVDGGPASRLVLRRTAEAGPLEWTDRAAEAAAMAQVTDLGLPVPRIHVVAADGEDLGAPWVLMDHAVGRSAMAVRGDDRVAVAADLGRHLAHLHRAAVPDPSGRTMSQATRDEVARWRDHYRRNRVTAVPMVDGLLAWCEATVPASDAPAILVWGDAGAHNALAQDGRITALLDWELAHAGNPVEDLASAVWIDEGAGIDPEVLVTAYEQAGGAAVDRDVLQWFVAMTCVTRSLMITVGAGAFVRGRTAAPHLAGLGLHLPTVNLARAAHLAGWVDGPPAPLDEAPLDHARPDDTTPGGSAGEASGEAPDHAPDDGGPHDVLRPTGAEIDAGIARFLRDDVLPRIDDPRTRRGLKTAAALLDTAAVRATDEAAVTDARRTATADLLADLAAADPSLAGDLATIAVRVESDPDLAHLRPLVRAHLVDDLAAQSALLTPLHRLYGG